jgi:hypothetical protein
MKNIRRLIARGTPFTQPNPAEGLRFRNDQRETTENQGGVLRVRRISLAVLWALFHAGLTHYLTVIPPRHYDELEMLPWAIRLICPKGPDGKHLVRSVGPHLAVAIA